MPLASRCVTTASSSTTTTTNPPLELHISANIRAKFQIQPPNPGGRDEREAGRGIRVGEEREGGAAEMDREMEIMKSETAGWEGEWWKT